MLMPRRTKHRKLHRGRMAGAARGGNQLNFGSFGWQALGPGWMTNRQIEAARRAMTRHVKRGGKFWSRVFPGKSISKKAAESRMGCGKGKPEGLVVVVKWGGVLVVMGGVITEVATEVKK